MTHRIAPRLGSTLLAGAMVVVFVVVSLIDCGTLSLVIKNQRLLGSGGATASTLMAGQWWRIVTSQFLHVYLLHAVLNAAAILILGSQLEEKIGFGRLLIVALVSGTIGQLVAVAVAPTLVATGASQAALGIASALIVFAAPMRWRAALITAVAYVGIQIALDLIFGHRIKLPHVASVVAGLPFGVPWKAHRPVNGG
jgi:rhomboid protease GluP